MKSIITILLLFVAFTNVEAKGIPIPVCVPCDEIATVQDLPESEFLVGDNGDKLNLGYMYQEYGVVFIPVWNTEGVYVLTNEKEDTYYDLDEESIAELQENLGVTFPEGNPLSIWNKAGGKVILGLLFALIIYGQFGSDDDEEEE